MVHGLLAQHRDKAALEAAMKQHGLSMYQRGNTIGVLDQDGKKHRLNTLGALPHYQEWQAQSQAQQKPKVAEKETPKPEHKPRKSQKIKAKKQKRTQSNQHQKNKRVPSSNQAQILRRN